MFGGSRVDRYRVEEAEGVERKGGGLGDEGEGPRMKRERKDRATGGPFKYRRCA
jgi:hypothetical protein